MSVRFVVGDTEDAAMNDQLSKEMMKYNDLIRVPCSEDNMEGVVKKSGEFLKWAHATYDYQWAFLTKDDSFVRLDRLPRPCSSSARRRCTWGRWLRTHPCPAPWTPGHR